MTVYSGTNADGRKLLRIEARNAETPIERKPPWIKTRMRTGPEYQRIKELVGNEGLHTVCQEARVPEHLRVLGGPRSHVPHRWRAVHPALRLLSDRHRQT